MEMIELQTNSELTEWFDLEEGMRIIRFGGLRTEPKPKPPPIVLDRDLYSARYSELLNRSVKMIGRSIASLKTNSMKRCTKSKRVSACRLTDKRAAQLEVDDGTAALRVHRVFTASDGRVLEVSISDHPEDRHSYHLSCMKYR